MLSLCLPPSAAFKPEYGTLFPQAQVELQSNEGRLELLRRLNAQLKAWKDLLRRFLKSNDDQVAFSNSTAKVASGWMLPRSALLQPSAIVYSCGQCMPCAGGAPAHL